MKDKNYYDQLRQEIINFYSSNIPNFNLSEPTDDLFNFPNFKEEGTFQDLNFELNDINADIHNSQLNISRNNNENLQDLNIIDNADIQNSQLNISENNFENELLI